MKQICRHIWDVSLAIFLILGVFLAAGGVHAGEKASSAAPPDWYYPAIVDADFLSQYATIPQRKDVVIVDSRPLKKYDKGHIVPAVGIPQRKLEKMKHLLPQDKSALLVFYCGGFKCPLSHKAAFQAERLGYKNVKVYAAGYPDWIKKGNIPGVSETYVKKLIDGNADSILVDARPEKKFRKGSVPTAINIPYRKFDGLTQLLPAEKDKELIFFCGGYKCPLSPKSAKKAIQLGYTKVKLFQSGYPGWKKVAGNSTSPMITAGGEKGSISIESFTRLIRDDPESFYWVDVRDRVEIDVDGTFGGKTALWIPMDEFETAIPTLPADKPLVFYCNNGARSMDAYDILQEKGSKLEAYFLEASLEFAKQALPKVVASE
ncbi:MAG: rhodanese-like domain-containing protein [Candidatus Thiodiazotropha sp. (ex Codakia rugifera)]|nr:rhodanese-like domain-containing protein [Candidatus Thiodiazotropha sp. (ex Codakia rugifera)]